jgi:hypothetical protein
MSLITIFNKVKKTSFKLNKTNPEADGLKFWQPIKKILEKEDICAESWKKPKKTLVNTVLGLPEYIINGKGEQKIIEQNHFIIQTVRIPIKEKPNLKKIIQIALNIGQCKGKGGKFNKYLVNRTKVTDYITNKDINKISQDISKETIKKVNDYLLKIDSSL